MNGRLTHLSKFLALVLRRRPGLIGLTPDEGGGAEVDELPAAVRDGRIRAARRKPARLLTCSSSMI